MALAPPAALEHLGALILGDHPLHLQQQIVLRGLAQGPVQEDERDPEALEFVY
jgi:hypothetical protein